ncbi:MAG: PPC domain-containing protein [Pseudomonadota bacterium]
MVRTTGDRRRSTSSRSGVLGVVLIILSGCGDVISGGDPPHMDPVPDQVVLVGQELVLVVTASDPEGGPLDFFIAGRPQTATFLAYEDGGTAVFRWTPEAADADTGGRVHEVEFIVKDKGGLWDSERVQLTVYPAWAPTFLGPTGYVLNLAKEKQIEFLVQVKDDGASRIDVRVLEGFEGAYLEAHGKKGAYFYWKPTEAQIAQKAYWYMRFSATGYATEAGGEVALYTIEHVVAIVLIHREQGGCVGTPPSVVLTPLGDQHGQGGYPIVAGITDAESFVASVTAFWTTGDPETGPWQAVPLIAGGGDVYAGDLPVVLGAGAGRFVHYYLEAWDDDDWAGATCDHVARVPKAGSRSFVAYGPGYEDACLEDGFEGQGGDVFEDAIWLEAGSWSELRACPSDADWYLVSAEGGDLSVTFLADDPAAALSAQPVDNAGGLLGTPMLGGETRVWAEGSLGGNLLALHVSAAFSAGGTYALEVGAVDEDCDDDGFEPDDTPGQAQNIASGEAKDRTICGGEEDWFRVDVPGGAFLHAEAVFYQADGDLDLYLVDGDGETILVAKESATDNESLDANIDTGGTYYLLVKGYAGASNGYNLYVEIGDQTDQCVEDTYAPNQSIETALMVPIQAQPALTLCPGQPDWFAVGLNGGETLRVTAIPVGGVPITVQILDPVSLVSPNLLASDTGAAGGAIAQAAIPGPGTYVYTVFHTADASLGYDLNVEVDEPLSPCGDDRWEPNDDPWMPPILSPGVLTHLKACGTNPDWFEFTVLGTQAFAVGILFDPALGDLDLTLWNATGTQVLQYGQGSAGAIFVQVQSPGTTTYLLEIQGDSLSVAPYDIVYFND